MSRYCYDPLLLIGGVPHDEGAYRDGHNYSHNSHGFRCHEIGPKRQFRIVVIGGSCVWGTGATSNETTIPAKLEKALREEHNFECEVINTGMSAYTSIQQLMLVAKQLIYLNPDLAVVYNGYNDIYVSTLVAGDSYQPNDSKLYYRLKSYLNNDINQESFAVPEKDITSVNIEDVRFNMGGILAYRKNMEMIVDILKGQGATSALFSEAYIGNTAKPLIGQENQFFEHIARFQRVYTRMYEGVVEACQHISRSRGVVFQDLRDPFDPNDGEVFYDWVHLNDRGYEIVAKKMANTLVESGVLKGDHS